jgi:hypothetical protein
VGLSGLYWVVPVPQGGLTWSDGGNTAVLQLKGLEIVDQPAWPAFKAQTTPAKMDIRIVWKATDEKVVYNDPQRQFRVEGFRAVAQLEAAVEVTSIGFSWKSDPLATSSAKFAIVGDEVNGRYYSG